MTSEPVTIHEYCVGLLTSRSLEDKLRPPVQASGEPLVEGGEGVRIIDAPVRCEELRMVDRVGRLPSAARLRDEPARRACLARFAHHELQTVELFAWALLAWPDLPESMKRGLLRVIADEQRHTRLYLERLDAMGAQLSDEPLSDYFWRHAPAILSSEHGPRAFVCAMGLTLEQANLDYTIHYESAFDAAGDDATAAVLRQVHDDEIQHVAHAWEWLGLIQEPGISRFDAYRHYVPFPFSASRARGKGFDEAGRREAGLTDEFIAHVRGAKHYGKRLNQAERGAILLPNFGEASWKQTRFDPLVVQVSALWRLLFSRDARVIDAPHEAQWWPADLGEPAGAPVFEGLEDSGRLVPWSSAQDLSGFCKKRKLRTAAAEAELTQRVESADFVAEFAQGQSVSWRGLVEDSARDAALACFIIEPDHEPQFIGSLAGAASSPTEEACIRGVVDEAGDLRSGSEADPAFVEVALALAHQVARTGYRGPLEVEVHSDDEAGFDREAAGPPTIAARARFGPAFIGLGLMRRVQEAGRLADFDAGDVLHWELHLHASNDTLATLRTRSGELLDLRAPQHESRMLRSVLWVGPGETP